jgi:hypothetical protein
MLQFVVWPMNPRRRIAPRLRCLHRRRPILLSRRSLHILSVSAWVKNVRYAKRIDGTFQIGRPAGFYTYPTLKPQAKISSSLHTCSFAKTVSLFGCTPKDPSTKKLPNKLRKRVKRGAKWPKDQQFTPSETARL